MKNHKDGATDPVERAKLRAELDGLIARLYGLTEDEFTHILKTFPLVPEPVRAAAFNAYRDVGKGKGQVIRSLLIRPRTRQNPQGERGINNGMYSVQESKRKWY